MESKLPYPVYFVCRSQARWRDLLLRPYEPPDPATLHQRFQHDEDFWVVLTYLYLRRHGQNVHLVPRLVPGGLCVISNQAVPVSERSLRAFIVAARGDGPRPAICHHAIVHNREVADGPRQHYMPPWPQPGLIPRERWRGVRVERLTFKGQIAELWQPFRSDYFRHRLKRLGVTFQLAENQARENVVPRHDYSEHDLVLAARDLTEAEARVRSAGALIDAWHAGTPALLGPESAYRQLRRSAVDFIEVRRVEEAIHAVRALQNEPDQYRGMLDNAQVRAQEFSVARLVERWCVMLAGPIADDFSRWRRQVGAGERLHRTFDYAVGYVQDAWNRRLAERERRHGRHVLSGDVT